MFSGGGYGGLPKIDRPWEVIDPEGEVERGAGEVGEGRPDGRRSRSLLGFGEAFPGKTAYRLLSIKAVS
jgi:hypothetical protein